MKAIHTPSTTKYPIRPKFSMMLSSASAWWLIHPTAPVVITPSAIQPYRRVIAPVKIPSAASCE